MKIGALENGTHKMKSGQWAEWSGRMRLWRDGGIRKRHIFTWLSLSLLSEKRAREVYACAAIKLCVSHSLARSKTVVLNIFHVAIHLSQEISFCDIHIHVFYPKIRDS